ncbi:pyridine nucleotide-disulfide oxidoreductase [Kosakonia sp. CCTCC M2018092]|uniref:FAD-dependent oxidoreductase n=1 Tax=Kosakonia sp. CCTCC M2018092 TaxID=2492396 RepID=UPI000F613E1D|nr:FAD-dependent oxidoreductase [Kosakonia sp. CCTCC M2018092]AZI88718.1 pyridine nucleotide-disulfide oxidoreductase [Kosakonia sp. CCTCC M2018092]
MNYQYVTDLNDLPENQPVKFDVDGTSLILIRTLTQVRAFQSRCPHAGAPLEQGAVCDGRLVCPWHKANFDITNGEWCEPLALQNLKQYPVHIEQNRVLVNPRPLSPTNHNTIRGDGPQTIVILGTGAAGSSAAVTLRDAGFNGHLMLIDKESEAPYDRTALSKFVPSGKMKISEVPQLLDKAFYAQPGVENIDQEVTKLDAEAHQLTLADGREITFDKLLLATGGHPVWPEINGNQLAGVHVLRDIHQAQTLLSEVEDEQQLVIVGNSFIAMELAAALRNQDVDVTVLSRHALPFVPQFGEEIGRHFMQLHKQNGVKFVTGEPAELQGDKHVQGVALKDGRTIPAHVVVFATGVEPSTDLVGDLPHEEDGSLTVDEYLRAAPDIWAVGDIATYPAPEGPRRIEHWRVAQQQGRIAALNMLGESQPFDRVPFFWTTHFGTRFEYLGYAREWDSMKMLGSFENKRFAVLYGQEGMLKAVLSCGENTATAELVLKMQEPLTMRAASELLS